MSVNVYYYKKDKEKSLSPHFKVKEFQCHNGENKILINLDLIEVLEKLFSKLNAKAINITSGYRTPAYSPTVGGYSTDQHTKGNAADIQVILKNGKKATGKEICCAVEDIKHKGGCGYISANSVHIDVRGYKCWFDETDSSGGNDLYSSYYSHFGISKDKPKTRIGYITGNSVRIRNKASLISSVLMYLNKGAKVYVIGSKGKFYNVNIYKGKKWYKNKFVSKSYVKL